jgi:hypothetical protein
VPNSPVNIPAGGSQSFVVAVTLDSTFNLDVGLSFRCSNTAPAPIVTGLNTLRVFAADGPIPEVIMIAETSSHDGVLRLTGTPPVGAIAVAGVNMGSGPIPRPYFDSSAASGLRIATCPTGPSTGLCANWPELINPGQIFTFSVFVSTTRAIPFDPTNNRITLIVDYIIGGGPLGSLLVTVGETSVAVTTE